MPYRAINAGALEIRQDKNKKQETLFFTWFEGWNCYTKKIEIDGGLGRR
jgi:hypothetical protein